MLETKNKTVNANAKKKRVRVSNQVILDAKNPIPIEYGGRAFSFLNNLPYLPFLNPDDTYAKLLVEARMLSTTSNACIVTKKNYCAGEGFVDKNGKEFTDEITAWFKSMNLDNESATKINRRIFEDFFTQGNNPIELVRFKVGGKPYFFVYTHCLLEWRLGKPDETGRITYALQSQLFLRENITYITPDIIKQSRRLPLYSPLKSESENWFTDENGTQRTLIWYKNIVTGMKYYGLPSNVASIIYELLEYKGARWNLDNFDNNMVVASILALKGNLSQEEANRIGKNLINAHTGDGKRGRTVVVASEEGIDDSNFHKVDNKTDGSFTEADSGWTQKIILSNEWDAILAGIVSPSTLGKGSGFITKILELKLRTVIKPAQQDLMDEVWNNIFILAQQWLSLPFDQYEIEIKNSIDISGLTDVDITPAVQINEVRQAKGLPEDPNKEGEYMKATGPASGPADPNKKGGDGV